LERTRTGGRGPGEEEKGVGGSTGGLRTEGIRETVELRWRTARRLLAKEGSYYAQARHEMRVIAGGRGQVLRQFLAESSSVSPCAGSPTPPFCRASQTTLPEGAEEPDGGWGRGIVAEVVKRPGGALKAPHIDAHKVEEYFGKKARILRGGGPGKDCARGGYVVPGWGGRDFREGVEGNHRSADKEEMVMWEEIVRDVASAKAFVPPRSAALSIPGLRVSPVGGVTENRDKKKRQILDLTVEVGKAVKATTAFEEVPECKMATVLGGSIQTVRGVVKDFSGAAHIVWQMSDLNIWSGSRRS